MNLMNYSENPDMMMTTDDIEVDDIVRQRIKEIEQNQRNKNVPLNENVPIVPPKAPERHPAHEIHQFADDGCPHGDS